jgi:hypothetical protein
MVQRGSACAAVATSVIINAAITDVSKHRVLASARVRVRRKITITLQWYFLALTLS